MLMKPEVYIYDALRTPCGKAAMYEVKPVSLLKAALNGLRDRLQLDTSRVDDCIIGCVTPTGDQGFNLARTALLQAGWNAAGGGMQINRYNASGLEAIGLGAAKIASGWASLIVAGGAESMTRTPVGADGGPLMYDPEIMLHTHYLPRGVAADLVATLANLSREELDAYAIRSHQRAAEAQARHTSSDWVMPIVDQNGLVVLDYDEHIRHDITMEHLAGLEPSFADLGQKGFDAMALHRYPALERIKHLHTAGNACPAADGAALVLLGSAAMADVLQRPARARVLSAASVGTDPTVMFMGAPAAARRAMELANLSVEDIDLWECHEDYAAITLQFQQAFDLPIDKLNVNGGAIALGNPLGASGAVMLGGLLHELERRQLKTGLAAISAGAGLATAILIERV